MTFEQILPALKQGKKVRRKGWKEEEYIYAENPFVFGEKRWRLIDEKGYAMSTINPSGIFADDWYILDEEDNSDKSSVSIGGLVCKVTSNFDEYEQVLDKFRCRLEDLREVAEEINGKKIEFSINFNK